MAQKTIQEQVQTQSQQLSTLQVALSSLLELPIAKLAERIRNEMLDNAALEEQESDDMDTSYEESERIDSDPRDEISEALDDYLSADDIPSYLQERADASAEHKEIPLTSGTSIYDDLVRQIGEHDLTSHERILINYLIGSLDENGFLRGNIADIVDELAIYHNITTSTNELIHILKILQTFEPRGIGAQNLQECLRLQLIDPDYHSPYKDLALTVIDTYFKEFTSKRWDIIVNRLKISKETASHVRHELTHLNPRPGNSLGSGEEHYTPTIIPDFYVKINSDGLPIVTLNTGDVPTLRISPAFHDSISQYSNQREHLSREQHDVYIYARQKVDAAQTFIALINRRQQTLFGVMEAIVRLQNLFLPKMMTKLFFVL